MYYSELDESFQFLLFNATLGIFRAIIKCIAIEVCMDILIYDISLMNIKIERFRDVTFYCKDTVPH